ncbi:hypothetical protein BGZ70_009960 [Mortierella alpina]|uniref:Large-conductance mechanosensitive channel n=1 Tax=Mortierella alpina TaxID=64518 RepID=A0A9P6M073_MORAP|nr:hypothetical protein BGZ70_009960 [Mortierella alpina]
MQPLVTPLNHDVVESVVIRVRDSADVTQKAVFYFWDEWKQFVNRGNVIDLGIGVVIGGAFSDIIDSFVVDILTPPLSLWATGTNLENSFIVLRHGKTPGKYATYKEAQADGAVTENTGHFLKSCLNFLVIAFFLFWIVKAAATSDAAVHGSETWGYGCYCWCPCSSKRKFATEFWIGDSICSDTFRAEPWKASGDWD